jgi:hypothetical protein
MERERELLIRYLIDVIDLSLAADDDGWAPDLAARAEGVADWPGD